MDHYLRHRSRMDYRDVWHRGFRGLLGSYSWSSLSDTGNGWEGNPGSEEGAVLEGSRGRNRDAGRGRRLRLRWTRLKTSLHRWCFGPSLVYIVTGIPRQPSGLSTFRSSLNHRHQISPPQQPRQHYSPPAFLMNHCHNWKYIQKPQYFSPQPPHPECTRPGHRIRS